MKRNEQSQSNDAKPYNGTTDNVSNTDNQSEGEWVKSDSNSTDYPLSAEEVNDPSQEGSVAVGSGLGIDE